MGWRSARISVAAVALDEIRGDACASTWSCAGATAAGEWRVRTACALIGDRANVPEADEL